MAILAAFAVPHPPVILAEVGQGQEKQIQKTIDAYRSVMHKIAVLSPDTVVITSPHSILYADYFHISPGAEATGSLRRFGAPEVKIKADYDQIFVNKLSETALAAGIPAGTQGERDKALDHGTIIPLYYLNEVYANYRLVRVGLSGLSPLEHYCLGKCISSTAAALGRRTVVIASGDLSHKLKADGPYGLAPEGLQFDEQVTKALSKGDFLSLLSIEPKLAEAAGECGLGSLRIMAGALDKKAVDGKLLSYEGPFGVGYAVAAFIVRGEDEGRCFDKQFELAEQQKLEKQKAAEDAYVRLARLSLETYIKTGKRAELPVNLPPQMLFARAGVFVSLKKYGQLRGCIGTIAPTTSSVAKEIMRNAVCAAVEDPRFNPVNACELSELSYSVDVLGEAEKINSPSQLDVKRYGVIVQAGGRRGLLLPNLEGIDSIEQQIAIAKQKAGIAANEPVQLFRFEVVRHK
ncbi:MAG: AmmeMemoRadiSam system protein A [Clostridia bacterium]|nr:AmmeMemoRadiSam system protein A [Clostridia bacterium]